VAFDYRDDAGPAYALLSENPPPHWPVTCPLRAYRRGECLAVLWIGSNGTWRAQLRAVDQPEPSVDWVGTTAALDEDRFLLRRDSTVMGMFRLSETGGWAWTAAWPQGAAATQDEPDLFAIPASFQHPLFLQWLRDRPVMGRMSCPDFPMLVPARANGKPVPALSCADPSTR
jgi:hypothetical protein